MKKILTVALLSVLAIAASAQELNNFSRGRQQVKSPEINGEKVTFRLNANYATVVNLQGNWLEGSIPMQKGQNGVWEVTIDTPSPEIYTYNFVVDGVSVNDPQNYMVQRDGTRYLNMLMVPGERSENYFEANQRGTVTYRWYDSKILGINRRVTVYTPYGYETSGKKYPVLYLLHGAGGDEEAWTSMGRTAQILDNLIEKGLAQPMIVVMPNGNPGQQAAQPLGLPEKQIDRRDPAMADAYVKSLCTEIVPFIEKNFRVIAKPESRAIAGLSMGSVQASMIACNHGDMFSEVGIFSGFLHDWISASPLDMSCHKESDNAHLDAMNDADEFNSRFNTFFRAIGNEDPFLEHFENDDSLCREKGINCTRKIYEGTHDWNVWRKCIYDFAQMIFAS